MLVFGSVNLILFLLPFNITTRNVGVGYQLDNERLEIKSHGGLVDMIFRISIGWFLGSSRRFSGVYPPKKNSNRKLPLSILHLHPSQPPHVRGFGSGAFWQSLWNVDASWWVIWWIRNPGQKTPLRTSSRFLRMEKSPFVCSLGGFGGPAWSSWPCFVQQQYHLLLKMVGSEGKTKASSDVWFTIVDNN